MKHLDFGDTASGRICDPNDFSPIRGAKTATGTVVQIFPLEPRVVGIYLGDGEIITIRVTR